MTINRRYEPDPAAELRLVEILYQLLLEPPTAVETASESCEPAPCLSPDAEG